MGDDHQKSHEGGSCNCQSANRHVHQTIDEMEFERGIWTAAMDNDLERVDKFISGGKMDAKDNFGYTALHYAARSGHLEVCRLLLRHGAEVDAQTKSGGVTPLQRAAMRGRVDVVRLLVETGRANVRLQDVDGKTALHRAVEGGVGSLPVVEYLLDKDRSLTDIKDNHEQTPADVARVMAQGEGKEEILNLLERKAL